jgi:hypothetical protein
MYRTFNQLHASLYMEKGFVPEKNKSKTSNGKSAKNKSADKTATAEGIKRKK